MSNEVIISSESQEKSVAPSPLHLRSRLKIGLLTALLMGLSLFYFRETILISLANAWVVNTPVQKSDAIYVLGGGMETRPFEAARLYREGMAPLILISNPEISRVSKIGLQPAYTDLLRAILIKEGVPESAIMVIGIDNASTHDEVLALVAWIKNNPLNSIIIPTDLFHSHRVDWLFQKELRPLNVKTCVIAIPFRYYSTEDWWKHEDGLITFQNEVIKQLYYRLKY